MLARAQDLALGDGHGAAAEPVGQRFGTRLDAQHRPHRLAVTDQHVGRACEGLDERARVSTPPQGFAVIEVEADRHAPRAHATNGCRQCL
ncbi:MAG: hypothetical protein AUJ01_16400 [Acidobacteria bacterium 13_1_40CM_3_65_5]|nr:MAG: hypothetical protein AUJ01_16400 [Acidobacteria bacterium 13_1_40CM_3_65_5]